MNDTQQILKAIGISSGLILAGGAALLIIRAYQSYYETKRAKLEVLQLRKELYGEDPTKN